MFTTTTNFIIKHKAKGLSMPLLSFILCVLAEKRPCLLLRLKPQPCVCVCVCVCVSVCLSVFG